MSVQIGVRGLVASYPHVSTNRRTGPGSIIPKYQYGQACRGTRTRRVSTGRYTWTGDVRLKCRWLP
eukprot:2617351-Rhodomonas_salina.3